ncbi:MAG TPA: zinc-binding dehydrogenase, partial [Chlamydiales bacterium]|nr:zinc-binding dehydrogenase [Chlamydiales bacterium]
KENVAQRVLQEYPQGVDVVFDCAGGKVAEESCPFIKKGGCLVSIANLQAEKLASPDIRVGFVYVSPNSQQLNEIARMVVEKKIKVPELTEFQFQAAKEAQALIETGHVRGKIVIRISS